MAGFHSILNSFILHLFKLHTILLKSETHLPPGIFFQICQPKLFPILNHFVSRAVQFTTVLFWQVSQWLYPFNLNMIFFKAFVVYFKFWSEDPTVKSYSFFLPAHLKCISIYIHSLYTSTLIQAL